MYIHIYTTPDIPGNAFPVLRRGVWQLSGNTTATKRAAVREAGIMGTPLQGPPGTALTSQHYSIEELKGGHQLGPHYAEVSLSRNADVFFSSLAAHCLRDCFPRVGIINSFVIYLLFIWSYKHKYSFIYYISVIYLLFCIHLSIIYHLFIIYLLFIYINLLFIYHSFIWSYKHEYNICINLSSVEEK